MAQQTNTFEKYDANSNREDLSDMIYDVSPSDTPVVTAIAKGEASNTLHEWSVDEIAAAGANAQIEGDDSQTADAVNPPDRLTNHCQILKKKFIVSGTQEKGMNHAGITSYMAYETAKKMKEIKRDLEWAVVDGGGADGIGNAKAAGAADGTAREMGSLQTYIVSNVSVGATGAAATGNGVDTMTGGTNRAFSEGLLEGVLQTAYNNGGDPSLLVMNAVNRGLFSDFSASVTRYSDQNEKSLVATVDVYEGDFQTLRAVPSRLQPAAIVYALDPEYAAIADLRALNSYDLAKTGDNFKKEMVWECTLEVRNEKAHAMIGDLGG